MKKLVLIPALAVGLLAITAVPAAAAPCPASFKVLHNDRIGPAELPAGNYSIALGPASELNCYSAAQLFTRFLQDWDGNLPGGWSVTAQGSGKAAFRKGGVLGFSVAKGAREEKGEPTSGVICPGTFSVNATSKVGPLSFRKGPYLIYLPPLSALSCNRASVLFTRFLGNAGALPSPWQVQPQTATFFKPAHPQRSAFRVESLGGAG